MLRCDLFPIAMEKLSQLAKLMYCTSRKQKQDSSWTWLRRNLDLQYLRSVPLQARPVTTPPRSQFRRVNAHSYREACRGKYGLQREAVQCRVRPRPHPKSQVRLFPPLLSCLFFSGRKRQSAGSEDDRTPPRRRQAKAL